MERVSQRDDGKTKYAYIAYYKLVRFDEVLTKNTYCILVFLVCFDKVLKVLRDLSKSSNDPRIASLAC